MRTLQVLYLSVLLLSMLLSSDGAVNFTQKPKNPSLFPVGSNATLIWDYNLDGSAILEGVIFDVKIASTFVSMIVKSSDGSVLPHPDQPSAYVGRVFIVGKATLVITNLTLNDDTEFLCTVKVKVGSVSSPFEDKVRLTVTVPPKTSVDSPIITADVGGNARFACNATGIPVPNITWTRENKLIPDNVKYQVTYNRDSSSASSELTVQSISLDDHGYYNCNATGYGVDETGGFIGVSFFDPVEESGTVSTIRTAIGQPYVLECPVRGFPPPAVTWKLPNGTVLASSLSITLAIVANVGNYTCSAKSLNNEVSEHIFTIENDVIILDSTVESGAPVVVKWTAVSGAVYYFLKITGDDIKADALLGKPPSIEIHLNTLSFKGEEKREQVKIDVQVQAVDDSYRLIARGDPRTATVSGAATFHACIVPLFVALMHIADF